jgi:hypothetical protein
MNDDETLLESTATTDIAPVPREEEVQGLFPKCCRSGLDGFLDSAVDYNECRVDEPGMYGVSISTDPVQVRKREVGDASEFVETFSKEKWYLLPL